MLLSVVMDTDHYQEALLEVIDANELPKHWGGNAVDEFDDPRCASKVFIQVHGVDGPCCESIVIIKVYGVDSSCCASK